MASIVERKNKNGKLTYRLLIRRKGIPCVCLTFGDYQEAKSWAKENEKNYIECPDVYQKIIKDLRLSLRRKREFF